jgi:hypothetical protein
VVVGRSPALQRTQCGASVAVRTPFGQLGSLPGLELVPPILRNGYPAESMRGRPRAVWRAVILETKEKEMGYKHVVITEFGGPEVLKM